MNKNFTALFKVLFFVYVISVICLMILTFNTDQMTLPKQLLGIEIDKIVHFLIFFPYPILAWLSFKLPLSLRLNCHRLIVIAISGLLLGAFTESAQLLNPHRSFDPRDMLANFIAIIAGTLVVLIICLFQKYKYNIQDRK